MDIGTTSQRKLVLQQKDDLVNLVRLWSYLSCKQYNGKGSDYQDEENMTAFDDNNIDDLA